MQIQLDKIIDRRAINRREDDPVHVNLLAEDFRLNGQLQPILVRQAQDGTYDLIAGGTRWLAAKALGWKTIEAYIREYSGKIEIASMAENLKRKNITPLEEADQVQWMNSEGNMSINEIAERTGHSREWVEKRMEAAKWPEDVKRAIHDKHIPLSAGRMLAEINDIEYRGYLIIIAKTNGATIAQVETWWLDYRARKKMIDADPNNLMKRPLPTPTKGYTNPCWSCSEPLESNNAVVVRICITCIEEVRQAKAEAAARGDNGPDQQNKKPTKEP